MRYLKIGIPFSVLLFALFAKVTADDNWSEILWSGAMYVFTLTFGGVNYAAVKQCPMGIIKDMSNDPDKSEYEFSAGCLGYWSMALVSGALEVILTKYGTNRGWTYWSNIQTSQNLDNGGVAVKRSEMNNITIYGSNNINLAKTSNLDSIFSISHVKRDNYDWQLMHYGYAILSIGDHITNETIADNIATSEYAYPVTAVYQHSNGTILSTISSYDAIDNITPDTVNSNSGGLEKRSYGGQYLTYTAWGGNDELSALWILGNGINTQKEFESLIEIGENIGQPNSISDMKISEKFCLAIGDSSTRTQNSFVVGEVYYGAYGGLDDQCMSG